MSFGVILGPEDDLSISVMLEARGDRFATLHRKKLGFGSSIEERQEKERAKEESEPPFCLRFSGTETVQPKMAKRERAQDLGLVAPSLGDPPDH